MSRFIAAFLLLLGLCSLLAVLSSISNRNLPSAEKSDLLGSLDKARLLETLHLRSTLGERAWQGWGSAGIPVIIWNQSYEFLFDAGDQAPAGWSRVPDDLNGQAYFRRAADDPQNFAVRVGGTWAASMATKQATDRFLIGTFQDVFPAPLKQIFPYRLLIQPSETQIGGLLHETFHVYQYQTASARMDRAESMHRRGREYESSADSFQAEWRRESGLLADALQATSRAEKIELVRQFLEVRDARRREYGLGDHLIDYERWLEWEEGTAKYIEVKILKLAAETDGYQPVPEIENDASFKRYRRIDQRWSQELFQLRHPMSSGETRLYMTGLAQAFMLDDLLPGWQEQYWKENVFLEDLLRAAAGDDD